VTGRVHRGWFDEGLTELSPPLLVAGRPMVHPPSQTVTANEGEPLDIVIEFCAEPSYTKVLWMSKERVYTPGAPSHDGVQALAIEVSLHVLLHEILYRCALTRISGSAWTRNSGYASHADIRY
jgi:hypothetical protein